MSLSNPPSPPSGADNTGASPEELEELLAVFSQRLWTSEHDQAYKDTIAAIQHLIAQEANKAQLAIVERILEASDGTDFVNQMANAAGELAKIYGELTTHKESKE